MRPFWQILRTPNPWIPLPLKMALFFYRAWAGEASENRGGVRWLWNMKNCWRCGCRIFSVINNHFSNICFHTPTVQASYCRPIIHEERDLPIVSTNDWEPCLCLVINNDRIILNQRVIGDRCVGGTGGSCQTLKEFWFLRQNYLYVFPSQPGWSWLLTILSTTLVMVMPPFLESLFSEDFY